MRYFVELNIFIHCRFVGNLSPLPYDYTYAQVLYFIIITLSFIIFMIKSIEIIDKLQSLREFQLFR